MSSQLHGWFVNPRANRSVCVFVYLSVCVAINYSEYNICRRALSVFQYTYSYFTRLLPFLETVFTNFSKTKYDTRNQKKVYNFECTSYATIAAACFMSLSMFRIHLPSALL